MEEKIDNNEQYSRRLCLRINEIPLPEDGNESGEDCLDKVKQLISELPDIDIPEVVIDRAHRIGKFKTDENGKIIGKQVIVRFTTWRHRTLLYKNRKKLKDVRIYLDLTKKRLDLLKLASRKVEGNENVSFAFSDLNCNLSYV